jgi:branched-chain amino acid transport system ATP-binding protein
MLRLTDVHSYYDESHILHGMSFELRDGEIATLIGRNGVGKTTTLRTIMGIVRARSGTVEFDGTQLQALASDRIAKLGIAYVPEERGIFSTLDVRENLLFAPVIAPGGWDVARRADRRARSGDRRAHRRNHPADEERGLERVARRAKRAIRP